jgi:hypothetical protein
MIDAVPFSTYIKQLVQTARTRASQREEPKQQKCTITSDQIEDLWNKQGGRCALSNQIMTTYQGHGKDGVVGTNGSIDRKDSSRGYTIDNVQLVCWCANRMKGPSTEQNFLTWCSNIVYNALYDGRLHDPSLALARA